ncbi:hypothetical protein M378DRAFT_287903 [Amanita muscaria Koide BX008]|uniref:Uncharacterized protein n=1 Tax=Amanita muscaria (strain Koide BX008) TaxID=946122 RepID=A0A0C2S831_AMAMK|nr:hypothetical protein M378DRAFT_287903 [Amanita muscaria Koide BX008]
MVQSEAAQPVSNEGGQCRIKHNSMHHDALGCSLGSSNKANRSLSRFGNSSTSNEQFPESSPSASAILLQQPWASVKCLRSNVLSSALLERYCFVNDFTNRIGEMEDETELLRERR